MGKKELIKIDRCRGLWGKCILRIYELNSEIKGLKQEESIEWAFVYSKLGRGFSINKQEVREMILVLRDLGFLDINPRGIKLNYEVKNG